MSSDRYHKAAKDGLLDVLREANKREVNAKDVYGRTPVLWSAFEGRLDALRLLVGRGGDPDKSDQFGNTALHLAAAKGHIKCADFLVKFGVNLFALDIDRHTAKDLAAINNHDDILRYLDAASALLERVDKRRCKQFREQADKQCEKRCAEYAKRQQKLDKTLAESAAAAAGGDYRGGAGHQGAIAGGTQSKLSEWKQRLWSSSQGNLKQPAAADGNAAAVGGALAMGSTKFSALVGGGTLSGGRGGTVQRRAAASKQQQQQQRLQAAGAGDFKVGEFEAGSGKRSVRSLHGVQRNSEVLYVGTFSGANGAGDPLKRGKLADVFGRLEETAEELMAGGSDAEEQRERGGGRKAAEMFAGGRGTMSRSYSQPDFMQQRMLEGAGDMDGEEEEEEEEEAISEEVMMQRPAGLFERPMLGSLAFRRSVSAALSELQPDTSSVGSSNNSSHKSKNLNARSGHLAISDSDSGGSASTDDDDDDGEAEPDGYSSLGRFLAAWGLEEHKHIFEKQQIDLDTLILLTESDLKSLNLPLGPFRKLAIAIQERKNALTSPGPITDSRL